MFFLSSVNTITITLQLPKLEAQKSLDIVILLIVPSLNQENVIMPKRHNNTYNFVMQSLEGFTGIIFAGERQSSPPGEEERREE